ncbi:cation:proton antiporter [Oceanimonas doudoroffii]|uniref:Sodium:proton antiporter n=1 Tax=Oceanimonas doudoroffii TaxID=84158 RepID=A0A233RCW8_9GAMM|nr:sodium:proton antiporter [Oceanimonas doudoroffii]OXY81221.1 sodium:proton antiporter [Oceanimonas doudoroffii]
MSVYYTLCFLAAMAITIAFVNQYIMKIQTTIAITSGALAISILMLILGKTTWPELQQHAVEVVKTVDFGSFLLQGILGFLLFAGGLGINLPALKSQKWEISVLVIVGVLISTLVVAGGLWLLTYMAAIPLPFIYCLLFGTLISPTDPIAVLAIVKKLGAPEQIAIQVEGESLFNDGIGLVAFLTIFAVAFNGNEASVGSVMTLFTHEAVGGIIFGALLGLMSHIMISATDDGSMELLMTLCVPTAGFAMANILGVSGALAMVVAGIIVGNWTRYTGFSEQSQKYLDHFWHLLDEFLNALLFLLIGLAMLLVDFHWQAWILMVLSVPLVLAGRFASVAIPYIGFRRVRSYNRYSVRILTWGGLRGGLSLAMALSIPAGIKLGSDGQVELRDLILMMTYAIVLFSIIVQGMTITPMINKAKAAEKAGFPID